MSTAQFHGLIRKKGVVVDYRDRFDIIRMSVLSLVTNKADIDSALGIFKEIIKQGIKP